MVGEDWLYRVDILISQGRVDEAQELLIGVVKKEPENVQAWLLLADSIPVPEERLQVLDEALRLNPNHQELQQMREWVMRGGPPKEAEPTPLALESAKPNEASGLGAFAFSPEEWKSFKSDAIEASPPPAAQESFHPPDLLSDEDDEKQWLETLRSMSWTGPGTAETPAVSPAEETSETGHSFNWQIEPPPVLDEVSPDLTNLAWQSAEPSPTGKPESAISFYGNPTEESALPLQQVPPQGRAQTSAFLGEIPDLTPASPPEEPSDEISLQDLDEPAPRRSWMIYALGGIILVVLVGAGFLAWPNLAGLFQPPPAALVVPTEPGVGGGLIATGTNTLTPTPSITPTSTRTRTTTPLPPSPTPSPVPLIVNVVPISAQNIQQFKLLAQSKGRFEFSNDARVGAALSDALTVRVWDVVKDEIRMELKGPRAPIQSVAVSPDGKLVAAACEEPAVYVWNAASGAAVYTLQFSKELVDYFKDKTFSHTLQLKFGPEGKTLVAASLLGITWWDLDTKQEHHLYPLTVAELVTFRAQAEAPKNGRATSFLLAFSPDGKSLAVGSPYKVYLLFWPSGNPWTSLATGKPLIDLKYFYSNMLAMWHPGTLSVWETISSRQILSYPGLKSLQAQEVPPGAAFRSDGKMMAVESENARGQPGAFKLIDLPSGKIGITLNSNVGSPIENPTFSADGKLIMGRSGGDLFVWEVATGKELRRIANRKGFSKILNDGRIYIEYSTIDTILWGGLP